jgi:hypothetical protein
MSPRLSRILATLAMLATAALLACPAAPNTAPWRLQETSPGGDAGGDALSPLTLERVDPAVATPEGLVRITLFGSGFEEGMSVWVGDQPAEGVLLLDPTRVNCNVPPHSAGLVAVRIVRLDGAEAELLEAFLYTGEIEILQAEPLLATTRGGVPVTITGKGFNTATRALIGGRMLEQLTLVSPTEIQGMVPARLQGRAGLVDVTVTDGFEQRTLIRAFRYVDHLVVHWIAPAGGPIRGESLTTLYGEGLEPGSKVTIGGVVAENVAAGQGHTLTVRTPPGAPGVTSIEIANGLEAKLLPGAFTYLDADPETALALVGIWPKQASAAGGSQVSLAVVGLEAGAPAKGLTVWFNGQPATVLSASSTENQVVVAVPPGLEGPAKVVVDQNGAQSTLSQAFEYIAGLAPERVSPGFGEVAGGTRVTLDGVGLAGASVFFGGAEATLVEATASGSLEVTTPAASAGLVDVWLVRGELEVRLPAAFEYRQPGDPKLYAVSPPEGAQSGGRVVLLHGHGFARLRGDGGAEPAGTNIRFGSSQLPAPEIIDDATVRVRSPVAEVGTANVRLGEAGLLAMAYRTFDPTQTYGGTGGGDIPEALNVSVIDADTREPIPQAFVILWEDTTTKYQGLSDDRGQLSFSDIGFGPFQMATASKDGYTTASVVDFDARDVTLMLIHLVPAPPGNGGPGPGTQLADGKLAGRVENFHKHLQPPPGSCEGKTGIPGYGPLCEPCYVDEECGPNFHCVTLADQGSFCTADCTFDAECPAGFICAGMGFGRIQCIPSPGNPTATCTTTVPDILSTGLEVAGGFTNGLDVYELETPPGESAVVCIGGYRDPDTLEFVPQLMGVRRGVFTMPGQTIANQDVVLDIVLGRTIRVRLDQAPSGPGTARNREVDFFLDLGSDGVFHMPERISVTDETEVTVTHFPNALEKSLFDASFVVYAATYPDASWPQNPSGAPPTSADASFVLLSEVTEIYRDPVFRVLPEGVASTRYGVEVEPLAMHGGADGFVHAAGTGGRILTFDGGYWGQTKTPVEADLRAIWMGSDTWSFAAGDRGALVRKAGTVWVEVQVPRELAEVDWWALAGAGDLVWLAGSAGVWTFDGKAFAEVLPNDPERPPRVRAIWAGASDDLWLVGDDGLCRHFDGSGLQNFDKPGDDFLHVHGTGGAVWAVGRRGRIARWDGIGWFDYRPVSWRDLHAVHAATDQEVWAAGDNGVLLRWDGERWAQAAEIEHVDLRGIWRTGAGKVVTGGLHTLVVGPFLEIPRPVNPTALGLWLGESLNWDMAGPAASFTWVYMADPSGFPFWWLMVEGTRTEVPLPDLQAAWGLQAIWPGPGLLRLLRVFKPGFDIDRFDFTDLRQTSWRSWSTADFATTWQ